MVPVALLALAILASGGAGLGSPAGITAQIDAPAEGSKVSGTATLAGEAAAGSPVSEVQYAIAPRGQSAGRWDVMPAASLSQVGGDPNHVRFAQPLKTRALANGAFTIWVRALDSSSPKQVSDPASANVTVENTPPILTVDAPPSPLASSVTVTGRVEAEAAARVSSVLVMLRGPAALEARAVYDKSTGNWTARVDLSGAPDGDYDLSVQAEYDATERTSSSPQRVEVRNPLALPALVLIALLTSLVVITVALVAGRVIENRRLRAAGVSTKDVVREPFRWRFRRLARRLPRVYGVAKFEGAGGSESVHTLDLVELRRDGRGWRTGILGKLTWRRQGERASATVFEVDEWRGRRMLSQRMLAITRKRLRAERLPSVLFAVRGADEDGEDRASALAAAGAEMVDEEARRDGRVREFSLKR